MSQVTMSRQLIPAQGTVEHRLLIDVLARMTRIWLDVQHQTQDTADVDEAGEPGTSAASDASVARPDAQGV